VMFWGAADGAAEPEADGLVAGAAEQPPRVRAESVTRVSADSIFFMVVLSG
jgi:hypothetical protein